MFDFLSNLTKSDAEKRQEILTAYLDDALTPKERQRFERLLASDEELRADLEQQRLVKENLRQLPRVPAPRYFTLDPALYGRPESQPAIILYPAMRAATVMVAIFFVIALSASFLTAVGGSSETVASAPSFALQEAEVAEPQTMPSEGAAIEDSVELPSDAEAAAEAVEESAFEAVEESVAVTVEEVPMEVPDTDLDMAAGAEAEAPPVEEAAPLATLAPDDAGERASEQAEPAAPSPSEPLSGIGRSTPRLLPTRTAPATVAAAPADEVSEAAPAEAAEGAGDLDSLTEGAEATQAPPPATSTPDEAYKAPPTPPVGAQATSPAVALVQPTTEAPPETTISQVRAPSLLPLLLRLSAVVLGLSMIILFAATLFLRRHL